MAWYDILPTWGWITIGLVVVAIIVIVIVAASRSKSEYVELRPMRHVPGLASGARARPALRR
jgi:hypothetical protein